MADSLAPERVDAGHQFEHEEATKSEAEPVEDVVNPLPFAIVEALLAGVFAPAILVSTLSHLSPPSTSFQPYQQGSLTYAN
jgi:hypothetical protein